MTIKDDISKAAKQIGLPDSQANNLWQALQEIQANRPNSSFATALLYVGALSAFLSMSWLYTTHLKDIHCLFISILYALIFFGTGSYFWRVKKQRSFAGLFSCLGIVMIPMIIYSLQNVMGWWPTPSPDKYKPFYRWAHRSFLPMEICTLGVACLVLYFIRISFITIPIYFVITFMSIDAVHLLSASNDYNWLYYCMAFVSVGSLLTVLGFALCKKEQRDFGFWSYLFGMFLCWAGLSGWPVHTEWGHFALFLISFGFLLVSSFFHRRIFIIFGCLGILSYIGHLTYIFLDSPMFSYILGATGFSIALLATFLMKPKKSRQSSEPIETPPAVQSE